MVKQLLNDKSKCGRSWKTWDHKGTNWGNLASQGDKLRKSGIQGDKLRKFGIQGDKLRKSGITRGQIEEIWDHKGTNWGNLGYKGTNWGNLGSQGDKLRKSGITIGQIDEIWNHKGTNWGICWEMWPGILRTTALGLTKSILIMMSTGVSPSSSLPAEELSVCDRTTSGSQRASSLFPRGVHITDDNVLTSFYKWILFIYLYCFVLLNIIRIV